MWLGRNVEQLPSFKRDDAAVSERGRSLPGNYKTNMFHWAAIKAELRANVH